MQVVFRELVSAYDHRQWKKGVRAADRILEAFPTHGETVAMKGLIVHSMGAARKAEAHELCKLALRYDIRSHVCWHVFGLVHRAEANYAEAVKCYKQALKIDPDKCVGVRARARACAAGAMLDVQRAQRTRGAAIRDAQRAIPDADSARFPRALAQSTRARTHTSARELWRGAGVSRSSLARTHMMCAAQSCLQRSAFSCAGLTASISDSNCARPH
jgi:tetratricopeptide (TPR) repeat protein